jgi:hypothetical protein
VLAAAHARETPALPRAVYRMLALQRMCFRDLAKTCHFNAALCTALKPGFLGCQLIP